MNLLITNGHIVSPLEERISDLTIDDGIITAVGDASASDCEGRETVDATNCWVTPGLIDLQVNGGPACNFWEDPTYADIHSFAKQLAQAGVTTILPTLITDDLKHLRKNIDFLSADIGVGRQQLQRKGAGCSASTKAGAEAVSKAPSAVKTKTVPVRLPGIHLEGPCLSPQRPGVHPPEHIQPLTVDVLKQIITDTVSLITLAPERDPGGDAIRWLQERHVVIALGHSNATYEEAQSAFALGVPLVTHTFNAMPPIHHRSPGAVTAALVNDAVTCCLICDGHHLSAPAVELIIKTKTPDRCILVTDVAHVGTSQGGLVGSSILLNEAVRNVVTWGIASFQDAIKMATFNPAKAMGWDNEIGQLAVNRQADVVIWDKQTLAIKHVIAGGQLLV